MQLPNIKDLIAKHPFFSPSWRAKLGGGGSDSTIELSINIKLIEYRNLVPIVVKESDGSKGWPWSEIIQAVAFQQMPSEKLTLTTTEQVKALLSEHITKKVMPTPQAGYLYESNGLLFALLDPEAIKG